MSSSVTSLISRIGGPSRSDEFKQSSSARVVTRRRLALKLERILQYELFAVDPDNGPVWLETVNGFENAEKRMQQRAAEAPGDYFIYNFREAAIVARVHTLISRDA